METKERSLQNILNIKIGDKIIFYWTSLNSQFKGNVIIHHFTKRNVVGILQDNIYSYDNILYYSKGQKITVPISGTKFNYWESKTVPPTTESIKVKKIRSINTESKIKSLQKKADALYKKGNDMVYRIPSCQPILSVRDKELRDKAWNYVHQANIISKEIDLLKL